MRAEKTGHDLRHRALGRGDHGHCLSGHQREARASRGRPGRRSIAVMRRMRYFPSPAASGLRAKSTREIGILSPFFIGDFFLKIFESLHRQLKDYRPHPLQRADPGPPQGGHRPDRRGGEALRADLRQHPRAHGGRSPRLRHAYSRRHGGSPPPLRTAPLTTTTRSARSRP